MTSDCSGERRSWSVWGAKLPWRRSALSSAGGEHLYCLRNCFPARIRRAVIYGSVSSCSISSCSFFRRRTFSSGVSGRDHHPGYPGHQRDAGAHTGELLLPCAGLPSSLPCPFCGRRRAAGGGMLPPYAGTTSSWFSMTSLPIRDLADPVRLTLPSSEVSLT